MEKFADYILRKKNNTRNQKFGLLFTVVIKKMNHDARLLLSVA